MTRLSGLLLAAALCGCASTGNTGDRGSPVLHDPTLRASEPIAASPIVVPLDAAARARLPRERVRAQAHGTRLDCEGVPLAAVLRASGAMPDTLSSALLSHYVLVQARDGARVLFSLAELDPDIGKREVYLIDRCDGRPLEPGEGPLRLIAPEDGTAARWVRQVDAITVIAAP